MAQLAPGVHGDEEYEEPGTGLGFSAKKSLKKISKKIEKTGRPLVNIAQVVTRPAQRAVAQVREKVIRPVVGEKVYKTVDNFTRNSNRVRWASALMPAAIPILAMDKRTRKPALQVAAAYAGAAAVAAGGVAVAAGGIPLTAASAGEAVATAGTALSVAQEAGLIPHDEPEHVDDMQPVSEEPGAFDLLMQDLDDAGHDLVNSVEI
jgi:hypothetical protein